MLMKLFELVFGEVTAPKVWLIVVLVVGVVSYKDGEWAHEYRMTQVKNNCQTKILENP